MRKLKSTIFFAGEPVGEVYTEEPFETVKVKGDKDIEGLLRDSYVAVIQGEKRIIKKSSPLEYVAFLYHMLTGGYWQAETSKRED